MSPLSESNHQSLFGEQTHKVFVTSESGIFATYSQIIASLRNESSNDLTLIYLTDHQTSHPLYKAELELLEKRFPGRLIVYFIDMPLCEMADTSNITCKQELLEVVINSNTKPQMVFYLIGNVNLTDGAYDCLTFLGIPTNQIVQQVI